MADTDTTVIDGLRAIVGDKACLDAAADMQPFTTDYRKLYHGKALAVVLPSSTQQVSEVLALCTKHDVPVVPQGGNTSLMGGAVPDAAGDAVVLNLRRMNQVLEIDAVNDTMTLQAGVTLQAARAAAETAGRLFPFASAPKGRARSAAISRPTRAAQPCCATATCATSRSASRPCCPMGAFTRHCAACARTTLATT